MPRPVRHGDRRRRSAVGSCTLRSRATCWRSVVCRRPSWRSAPRRAGLRRRVMMRVKLSACLENDGLPSVTGRLLHDHSRQIQADAEDSRVVAASIDAHWFDGKHNAANNVRAHGQWLESADAWAQRLSVAGEAVAHAFETAKAGCPGGPPARPVRGTEWSSA
jgi:hypothetical protein